MRTLTLFLLLLGVQLVAWGQPASRPARYQFRNYPLDSLRWLRNQPGIADTLRVYFLNRLSLGTSKTDLPAALQYMREAYDLAHCTKYLRGELNCLKQLGNIYSESGDYVAALSYYQKGVDLATRHHKAEQLARLYLNMGATAANTGDAERSIKYLLMGYELYKHLRLGLVSLDDSAMVFSNLGNAYLQLRRYGLARKYALRAVALVNQVPNSNGAAEVNSLLGRIYEQEPGSGPGRLDSANKYYQRALLFNKSNAKEQAGTLLNLAGLFQQQRRFALMRDAARRSLDLAKQVGLVHFQAEAARLLAAASAALGDKGQAYTYSVRAAELKAAVLDMEKTKALAQLQVRFDVQAREHQIKVLEREATTAAGVQQEQEQRQRWILQVTWMLGLCLFGGGVLYWRLQKNKVALASANVALASANVALAKANGEIRTAMVEKEVLVQEIHHRVKNNLQLVRSLLSWQASVLPDPALIAVLDATKTRIQSMAMVHEFLYQSENLALVRMGSYLSVLLDALHKALTAPDQTVHLTTDFGPLVMEAKEASTLGVLVSELVTNAYKHAFAGKPVASLHVALLPHPKGFCLRVVDDGAAVNAADVQEKPNSLGMRIVKQLARQLKATVSVVPQQPAGMSIEVISE